MMMMMIKLKTLHLFGAVYGEAHVNLIILQNVAS